MGAIAENVKHRSLKELFACVEMEILEAGVSDTAKDMVMGWSPPKTVGGLSFRRLSIFPFAYALFDVIVFASFFIFFCSFDIMKVLEFGAPLVASIGQVMACLLSSSLQISACVCICMHIFPLVLPFCYFTV